MKWIFSFSLFLLCIFSYGQQEIKIMSYNIRLDLASDGVNRWDARKDKVAGLMNYYEADFIGTQEVLHHQLTYLLEKLDKYSFIGVGRDDGKQAGEYSCIFYKKENFTPVLQSTFWLSPTPDSVSKGWDAAYKRVCTYGLFKNKKTKQFLWVFNTHLDNVGVIARRESVKLIIEKINQVTKEKNYPVILMGDFNSKPEEEPVQYVKKVLNYTRDVSMEPAYGPADTWNAFAFDKIPDGCIDYIFMSNTKRLSVRKFATLTDSYDKKYPSDHLPILATILIPEN